MPESSGSPSLTDSSVADFDFSALGEAKPDTAESTDQTPDTKTCPVCGNTITRAPGSRGRMPKYHPECRPSATSRVAGVLGTPTKRTLVRDAKAGKEADEVLAWVKPKLVKGATALMLFDQYDGFVAMTTIPGICENLHGILVSYDGFRKQMLNAKSGGSILGMIVTLAIPIAAILAHHGLIPQSRVAEIMKNIPIMMHKISARMAQGEQAMNDMMQRVADKVVEEEDAKKEAEQRGNTNNDTTTASDPYLRNVA